MRRSLSLLLSAVAFVVGAGVARADVDPTTLPQVSYHPGGPAYWDRPYFANAMAPGQWVDGNWTNVPHWNNPQFDANGYPQFLQAGQTLRAIVNGLNMGYAGQRPADWPDITAILRGRVVLTWQGNADLRMEGGAATYLQAESSGPPTGSLPNGRRVYLFTGAPGAVRVFAITSPITDIKVWLPDPGSPQTQSLEGQLFHPALLARLGEAPWGYIRFMDWGQTNASPLQDWSDRRRPSHAFAVGVLNPRPPATGFSGNRGSGVAFEHMVALANASGKDLWINVPHLASDDFVTRLAQLVRYGSDGANPYTSPQANPVWPPLAASRRVYVEYSNEIWSNGDAFAQGNWAQEQATAQGMTKARFNGRRFAQVFRIFQVVFGGSTRLVRVAAVFTANQSYTAEYLGELRDYGPTLSPPVEPDVIACTTYFGNGIQDWAHETAQRESGGPRRWFYTGELFDAGGGQMRPVSWPAASPYWRSRPFRVQMQTTFAEWRRRMLSGSAAQGGGPDATGMGGGFDLWLRQLALTTFLTPKALVAYEGGPSLYTDYMDGGDLRDDGVTTFVSSMNRQAAIRELYAIHLNMARSKGLRTHSAFVDTSVWGKYGQWGHLEHLQQPLAQAPKHAFLLDWVAEMANVRHVDDRMGTAPSFQAAPLLPPAFVGTSFTRDLLTTGGEGFRSAKVIGASLVPGLGVSVPDTQPDAVRIEGRPRDGGMNYVYARVTDADGDPAWRVFSFYAAGGPFTLADSDFRGTNPGLNTPWTPAYVLGPKVGLYTGWARGAGVVGAAGNDALHFSVNAPATESTLAQAVAENEYLALTVQAAPGRALTLRSRELRFTIDRQDFHAPRRYAVFTSVGGFTPGQEIFLSGYNRDQGQPREYVVRFPDSAAYDGLTAPLQIRIYGFAAQFGGHRARLVAFKLTERVPTDLVTGR